MGHADTAHTGLAEAIACFPGQAAQLRRLMLSDRAFRSLCEDYALARASLAGFEVLPDADSRPEIADYRMVIAELESEIARFVTWRV
jgi:hypothetical protein